jgi:hypothetical protein
MADKTTYTVEVWDPTWEYELGGDGWSYYESGKAYDTFAETQDAVVKANNTYRQVQVAQHTRRIVAEYKDGQVSG